MTDQIQSLSDQFAKLQTLSILTSRASLAARLGMTYDGQRDLYQALGYPTEVDYVDLVQRYYRQDIVRAVVERPIKATWGKGFQVYEAKNDQTTAFEVGVKQMQDQFKLDSVFNRLDTLCAFGSYAILLMGWDDTATPDDFRTPVQGKRLLRYVRPFGQMSAQIQEWDLDFSSERYGRPLLYAVSVASTEQDRNTAQTLLVHFSRVLHVVDGVLEDEVLGRSRLEVLYNRFLDVDKLVGGSAEMFWRGARPGYQGKVDPEFVITEDTRTDLKAQIDEFEHNLRRILVNQGIDLQALQQQVSDPTPQLDVQVQLISAATGIPKRILVGSERGELASTQDQAAWSVLISDRQKQFAETQIVRPFIQNCIDYGMIPAPTQPDFTVEWASVFDRAEEDQVRVGQMRASALKEYTSNPATEAIVPPQAFFEFFLGFSQDQIDLITEMVEEGMQEEEAAVKQLGITPEQLDQIQNPDKYINGKKIIPGTEPAQQQPYTRKALADTVKTQELESNSFPGHKGRPGHVGGSVAGVGEEGAKGAKAPGAKSLLSDAAARKEAITRGVYVPPGWHDIVLNPPGSERIVYGKDEKGRVVSSYTDEFRNRNKDTKFNRVRAFAEVHDSMMKRVNEDFDKHDEAKVLYLINKTGFRVGGRGDTKADVLAYGASTLKPEHIRINGDAVEFIFTGKKGVSQDHIITDAKLARMLKGRMGQEQIFNTNDDKVRQYLKTIDPTGKNFLVKDLRTYVATSEAAIMIKSMKRPTNEKELKEYKKAVAQRVSAKLGNRWQESLKSYIDPAVFHVWEVS